VRFAARISGLASGLAIGPHNYTVAEAVQNWLEFGLSHRDPATVKKCAILASRHIIPALEARKLRELSADDVDRWLGTVPGMGLVRSNCQYLWIRYLVDHVSSAASSTSKPSVLLR
jgi:hypothetical protein